MPAAMLSFQRLHVYQRSIEFLAYVVELLEELHDQRGHAALIIQLLRAAQSQPLNIAEGAGRRTPPDRARFYMQARGSAMESAAVLDTLRTMRGISPARHEQGLKLLEEIIAMLTTLAGKGSG